MYRGAQQRTWRPRGMTLVELVLVMAILLILAALLLPYYLEVMDTAHQAFCLGNMAMTNSAAGVYFADHLSPAPSIQSLIPDYLSQTPQCPFGTEYEFDGYAITNVDAHCHLGVRPDMANDSCSRSRGKSSSAIAPPPSRFRKETSPPWRRAIFRARVSPMPVPSGFVVLKG